jgi:glucosamine--fructose-6-phosphate aminotransferase (isomerizing)
MAPWYAATVKALQIHRATCGTKGVGQFTIHFFKGENITMGEIQKNGYPHYMLKEIYEQPEVIKQTLKNRLIQGRDDIVLDDITLNQNHLAGVYRIIIVACGTSYHAGLAGKHLIERLAGIPSEVEIASEFRFRDPVVDKNNLVIVISQSGETADTLDAMRKAKAKGASVLAITNVVGSTISNEADFSLYTCAGPEISVASTKAYTSQLTAIYLLALKLACVKGSIDTESYEQMKQALNALPKQAQKMLDCCQAMKELAEQNKDIEKIVYLGRGLDYALALEGSLKLKETCYIHSAAYSAGEFRHGPIALVEDGLFVFFLATQDELLDKSIANLREIKDRGAYVVALAKEGNQEIGKMADRVIYIPAAPDEFTSALAVIPLQFFAYYTAVARGNNVDKPRSLVKSVSD